MFVEAVKFQIERADHAVPSTIEWGSLGDASRVPDASWYFETTISRIGFSPLELPAQVRKLVSSASKDAKIVLAGKMMAAVPDLPLIRSLLSSVTVSVASPKGTFIRDEDPFAIVIRSAENAFVALTEKEEDCEKIVGQFKASFKNLSEVTRNFGFRLGRFAAGKNLARDWVKANPLVRRLTEKEPTNDFEREVIGHFRRFSSSFISNVEVVFRKPSESAEYDIILVLSDNRVMFVEVMDYHAVREEIRKLKEATKTFKENIKSVVVLHTMDKVARLYAGENIEIAVFLNGFPADVFSQVRQIAESRGLVLLDGEDLEEKVRALFGYCVARLEKASGQNFDDYLNDYREFLKSLRRLTRKRTNAFHSHI
jgi:hypothetical protein